MLELALPNLHALAVMIMIVVALVLFTRDSIPMETTSLVVLAVLATGFQIFPFKADGQVLTPSNFFLGFGNRALIAVSALMIVGQGLISTGALEPVGRLLARSWRRSPALSLLLTLRAGESIQVETIQRGKGVFINPLPDVKLRAGDRIATSNTQQHLREYARLLGGTLYTAEHAVDANHPLSAEGQKIAEVAITPASRLNGVRIGNAGLLSTFSLRLLAFNRFEGMEERESPGLDETRLRSGDVLLVQSTLENLAELKQSSDFLILDGSINLPRARKAPIALAVDDDDDDGHIHQRGVQ